MKKWHILIVDDDIITITLLNRTLSKYGNISSASNGHDALLKLKTEPLPDLILLDALMPKMNGYELCSIIKSDTRLSNIPIIFVTGNSESENEIKALEVGAIDFITKPLILPVVKARITTHLKIMEQQQTLIETNKLLKSLIENKSSTFDSVLRTQKDPIWFKNVNGCYLAVNPTALKFFNREEIDLIGFTDEDAFSLDYAEKTTNLDLETINSGNTLTFELSHVFPEDNGERIWEMKKTPVFGHNNEFIGILSTAQDITEKKHNEQHLQTLSMAVEQNPNSIIITDNNKNIKYINKAFTENTGYAAEEILGQKAGVLRSSINQKTTYQELNNSLNSGIAWKGRFYNKTKDGKELIHFAHISPIRDNNGDITHYLSIQEDITEKIKLADEVAKSYAAKEAAEAANEAKSIFLANMSHEIRTPMNAILGLAHILLNTQLTDEQKQKLNKIENAGTHLLGIINDILDISKIEAGKMELSHTDFSFDEIINNLNSIISNRIKEKKLNFILNIDDIPKYLNGDSTRLIQILLNYIGNAIKFTDNGNIILTGKILEETSETIFIKFEIKDSGIGISKESLSKLFIAFEQADNSTKRKYGGTGLGLKINKHLAQLMGGNVGVESLEGIGSTFWVTLKLGKCKDIKSFNDNKINLSETEILDKLRFDFNPLLILVAEDNIINQEVALCLLKAAGITTEIANNGNEAINMAKNKIYDFIFMDMQMPEVDGINATKTIRTLPNYKNTPIIAMTANAFNEDKQLCLNAGMNEHLGKPVAPLVFYTTLLKWLLKTKPINKSKLENKIKEIKLPAQIEITNQNTNKNQSLIFHNIDGLNYDFGLKQLSGNKSIYERLLFKFANDLNNDLLTLNSLLTNQNFEQVRKLFHKTKGSAGTLGAERIFEIAKNIELIIKEQKHTDKNNFELLIKKFNEESKKFSQEIKMISTD